MEEKNYFKNMFKGIDDNIVLDEDQINIIKDKSKCLIVVAGAGSGKTTTMSAKAKYLVDYGLYKNSEILIISYTNKAVKEIDDYVNSKFNLNIDIMTFHKLALNILKNNKCKVNLLSDKSKFKIFKDIILSYKNTSNIIKIINNYNKLGNIIAKDINNVDEMTIFCIECIDYLKTKGISDTKAFLYSKITDDKLYYFADFLLYIYKKYDEYCNTKNFYDFDDLIIKCIKYVNKNTIPYRFIIIDEYQDISKIRFNIVEKLSNFCNITVVGDDWQSIYSFSGSSVSYFLDFKEKMNANMLMIKNTYRNSLELVKITGNFVMRDDSLIRKDLNSNKHLKNPINICFYRKNINNCFEKIIKSIIKEYGINKNILILGRYKDDIKMITSTKFIINNNTITYINNRKGNIKYMTIHSSKGVGFDNVVILNMLNSSYGFPSNIENNFFKKYFFNEYDNIKEERRLFYVAITRARDKLYISSCLKRRHMQSVVECTPSRFLEEIPSSLVKYYEPPAPVDDKTADEFFAQMKKRFSAPIVPGFNNLQR